MLPMEDEKAEKISISVPKPILAAMDRHVSTVPSESRSGWLTGLAARELESLGVMGESEDDAKFWAKAKAEAKKDPALKARIARLIPASTRGRMVAA